MKIFVAVAQKRTERVLTMHEILFRGKQVDNGEWVEGNLFVPDRPDTPTQICIGTNIVRISYDVDPSTVGQYTGLTDKNGKKIFEGDIVKGLFVVGEISSVVIFKYGYFGIEWNIDEIKVLDPFLGLRNIECEVIGNIHDNPELLKGGDTE